MWSKHRSTLTSFSAQQCVSPVRHSGKDNLVYNTMPPHNSKFWFGKFFSNRTFSIRLIFTGFTASYLCPSSMLYIFTCLFHHVSFQSQNLGFQIMIDIFVLVSIIKNVKYEILNAVNYSHVTSNVVKSGRWFDNFLNNASGVDLNSPGNVCHGA